MLQRLRSAAQSAFNHLRPEAKTFEGITLPSRHKRFGGHNFADDRIYLESAKKEAQRLAELGLNHGKSILEIGCGTGRLAIGLVQRFGENVRYTGLDIDPNSISWCQRHLSSEFSNLNFLCLDVYNERYNPHGQKMSKDFRMPFADGSYDFLFLYSVFSHMVAEDIAIYLGEFRRIISPGGRIFLTAFVEDGVPAMDINPSAYRRKWDSPLHCVRFENGFFQELLNKGGFEIIQKDYAQETDGQSGYLLAPR